MESARRRSASCRRRTWARVARLFTAIMASSALLLLLLPVATGKVSTRSDHNDPRRIRMDSLTTLYFKDGMQTWSRRGKRFSQLQCAGNSKHICSTYAPDVVMCRHMGDLAWRCDADLHKSVRMGAVDVSCEGWDGPDDEYILRGSCLLKYNLLPAYKDSAAFDRPYEKDRNSLVLIAIIAIFIFLLWLNNRRPQQPAGNAPRGGGGGGGPSWFGGFGGGPGGAPHDPPPPYRPYPKQEDGSSSQAQGSQQSWRPGFWSGLGAGALAAEAARFLRDGAERNQRYAAPSRQRSFFGSRDDDDDDDSFGGSGGGNAFGSAGPSGGTHRSSGFGGSTVR